MAPRGFLAPAGAGAGSLGAGCIRLCGGAPGVAQNRLALPKPAKLHSAGTYRGAADITSGAA